MSSPYPSWCNVVVYGARVKQKLGNMIIHSSAQNHHQLLLRSVRKTTLFQRLATWGISLAILFAAIMSCGMVSQDWHLYYFGIICLEVVSMTTPGIMMVRTSPCRQVAELLTFISAPGHSMSHERRWGSANQAQTQTGHCVVGQDAHHSARLLHQPR